MARRETKNRTNIPRIVGIPVHQALVSFICIRCSSLNTLSLENGLLSPIEAFENESWECNTCHFVHSKSAALPIEDSRGNKLPFSNWDPLTLLANSVPAERFWKAFFTSSTEAKEAYWKQCNTCGRKLPSRAFSRHVGWGALEKQMECRSCKAVINTNLNPKRTKEQLHESSARRRTADLLLVGTNERLDLKDLFMRFGGKCFKTGKPLNIQDRASWAIDHILLSRWLYPLTKQNAALLSKEANDNKRDKWPSEFYSNEELKRLASITGISLELISNQVPIINQDIDVNACVTRMLNVRNSTNMHKRIQELKKLLEDYSLVPQLSAENKRLLDY